MWNINLILFFFEKLRILYFLNLREEEENVFIEYLKIVLKMRLKCIRKNFFILNMYRK